uniref:Putative secreted protein n=1 Tax=Ixodes ricinus TaxID=34613 RepID=A0A6B0U6U0_IXORI
MRAMCVLLLISTFFTRVPVCWKKSMMSFSVTDGERWTIWRFRPLWNCRRDCSHRSSPWPASLPLMKGQLASPLQIFSPPLICE